MSIPKTTCGNCLNYTIFTTSMGDSYTRGHSCKAVQELVFHPIKGSHIKYGSCDRNTGNCPDFQQKLSLWQRIFG